MVWPGPIWLPPTKRIGITRTSGIPSFFSFLVGPGRNKQRLHSADKWDRKNRKTDWLAHIGPLPGVEQDRLPGLVRFPIGRANSNY
jgi:hypothetical protein